MIKKWLGSISIFLFSIGSAWAVTVVPVDENPTPTQITQPAKHITTAWAAKQPIAIPPIHVEAKAWILLAYPSGDILSAHNEDVELPPASITKLMTALIVSQRIKQGTMHLDDPVKISVKAWKTGGSKMFIKEGDTIPLGELLKGMIIESGNDAAVAIAEHISGSTEDFAQVMNETAKSIGLTHTHYKNPNGQPAKGHYSSARDISKIAMILIRDYPDLYKTYGEESFTWSHITQPNRNGLLKIDKSVDGLKTGYTQEAGYCLAASAKRKNTRLIAIVLGTKSPKARTQEAKRLIEFGFRYYAYEQVLESDQILQNAPVWYGAKPTVGLGVKDNLWKFLEKGKYENIKLKISFAEHIEAPVHTGDELGTVEVKLSDDTIATMPLIAKETVERGNIIQRTKEWFALNML